MIKKETVTEKSSKEREELHGPVIENKHSAYFKELLEIKKSSTKYINYVQKQEIFNKAVKLRSNKHYEEAEEMFLKLIEIDPLDKDGYYNLAVIQKKLQNYSASEENFLKAVSLDPKDKQAFFGLGLCFYAQKKYNEAEKSYLNAIMLDKYYQEVYYNLAILLIEIGRVEDAEKLYLKATRIEKLESNTSSNKEKAIRLSSSKQIKTELRKLQDVPIDSFKGDL